MLDERLREFTRVCESLREFARVCVMSLLQYMKFVRWPVMKDSPVRVGAYEVKRKMYKSCASGEMVGHSRRQMSGDVGPSRHKSGKVGRNIFCPILVVVTLLHQFLRIRSLFPVLASSLRCSSTTPTDDRLMPVSWRWGQVVGSGRVRS